MAAGNGLSRCPPAAWPRDGPDAPGRRDEARAALEKASGLYRTNVPQFTAPDPGRLWADILICEILLHEAEALILLDPAFPADPFAR